MTNEFQSKNRYFYVSCFLYTDSKHLSEKVKAPSGKVEEPLGIYVPRFVTCSSSERSEVRVSIVVPRYRSNRMRAKRLGLV